MTEISLVLPFAVPPPEFAPDLVRALQTPALASLLSRAALQRSVAVNPDARALPHELWLARALGLANQNSVPLAAAAMRGFGLDPADGTWFIVNPTHFEIGRRNLVLHDVRRLRLDEAHSRALFDSARPYFEDAGYRLLFGDAQTWFMRADRWAGLETTTVDAAAGMSVPDGMPSGEHAIEYRKLQNEVQMLWHEHPANEERTARGQSAINSFWLWGPASAKHALRDDLTFAASHAAGWLGAVARQVDASFDQLAAAKTPHTVFCDGSLVEPAMAEDWSSWLTQMQRLDQELFAPALAALSKGRIGPLRLVFSHRTTLLGLTATKMGQRQFWRSPTLKRLLP